MTDVGPTNPNHPSGEPDEEFIAQVRDVLAHLYDLGYLQGHPLAPNGAASGQQLKRQLLETVEALNPGPAFYFRAPQARPYNMLLLHYIERLTIQKAASELGISERQAYRELREGENSAARLLWGQYGARRTVADETAEAEKTAAGDLLLQAQLPRPETVPMSDLLEGAVATVQRLASQSSVKLLVDLQGSLEILQEDQAAVRQILVSLLSRVIQAAAGDVCIRTSQRQDEAFLVIAFHLKDIPGAENVPVDPVVQQLLQQAGWVVQQIPGEQGAQRIEFRLEGSTQATVLHIDDDEGFSNLLKRYLNGRPVRLIHSHSGVEGIETARSTRPALIILDVMMPGLDGWETLQRLQLDPETMGIPLVICSVFNDPELARSLGARQLLPKPVSQERFLDTLSEMGVRIG